MTTDTKAAGAADQFAELVERYKPSEIPTCRVCDAPLSVQAIGGGEPTRYACSAMSKTTLPTDWEHYERSRWEDRRQGGDARVIELIDAHRALLAAHDPVAPRLIGWRTDDYLMETADPAKAKNWEVHHRMLPIFEGDKNSKLSCAAPVPQAAEPSTSVRKSDAEIEAIAHRVCTNYRHATSVHVESIYAFTLPDLLHFVEKASICPPAAPVPQAERAEAWIVVKEHVWEHGDGERPTLAYLWPSEFNQQVFASSDEAMDFAAKWPLGWVAMKLTLPTTGTAKGAKHG